jgi:hypothetical protein
MVLVPSFLVPPFVVIFLLILALVAEDRQEPLHQPWKPWVLLVDVGFRVIAHIL